MGIIEMMTPEAMAGAGFLGFGFVYLIAKVLAAIGSWKVFKKCGEAGWKAFIPFYNKYIRFNLYWDKKFFWIYLVMALVSYGLGSNATGVMALVALAAGIGMIITTVKVEMKCARCFGKGTGMGILLIVMPWLANIILGFGKAEYTAIEK